MSTPALAAPSAGASLRYAEDAPVLSVVHHPDPAVIGRRILLSDDEAVLIGRGGELFGQHALVDDRLSRRHLMLSREGRNVYVEDQASRNGTTINGRRVGASQLRQGDVLGIGRLLLLFHWIPQEFEQRKHPRVIGESPALAATLAAVLQAAEGDAPVLIQGEAGVGRRHLAYEVHRANRKGTPYGVLDCSTGKEPPWDRICKRVGSGTLVLSDFDLAAPPFQKKLLDAIDDPRTPFRVVVTMSASPRSAVRKGLLLAQLGDRLGEGVRVPPLRHRPEDILPLVRYFARQSAGSPRHISRRLSLMLLLLRWPGNANEVKKTVERLVTEQRQHLTLRAPTWLADQVK